MVLIDGNADVNFSVDGAPLAVVTTVDGTFIALVALLHSYLISIGVGFLLLSLRIVNQTGSTAVIFHISLIDIAGMKGLFTIGTTEDAAYLDGGTLRNVDLCTAGDTLTEAAAIGRSNLSMNQVYDGRILVLVSCIGRLRVINHSQSAPSTSTEDFRTRELGSVLRCIYQYIAAVLHHVAVGIHRMSLSGTEDTCHGITVVGVRLEVHEGIVKTGFGIVTLSQAVFIKIFSVVLVFIFVVTIAATKDVDHTALNILHVGGGLQHIAFTVSVSVRGMNLAQGSLVDSRREVLRAQDSSTQVVTAIEMVTNPWETFYVTTFTVGLSSDIRLGMS